MYRNKIMAVKRISGGILVVSICLWGITQNTSLFSNILFGLVGTSTGTLLGSYIFKLIKTGESE